MMRELAGEMQQRLRESQAEVALLKMTLSPDSGQWDIGVVNLVRNDFLPELSMALKQPGARRGLAIYTSGNPKATPMRVGSQLIATIKPTQSVP